MAHIVVNARCRACRIMLTTWFYFFTLCTIVTLVVLFVTITLFYKNQMADLMFFFHQHSCWVESLHHQCCVEPRYIGKSVILMPEAASALKDICVDPVVALGSLYPCLYTPSCGFPQVICDFIANPCH